MDEEQQVAGVSQEDRNFTEKNQNYCIHSGQKHMPVFTLLVYDSFPLKSSLPAVCI